MPSLSPPRKLLLAVLSLLIYAALTAYLGAHNHFLVEAIALLPIAAIALLYGVWGGLAAGLLLWPAEELLYVLLTGQKIANIHLFNDWAVHLIFLIVGVVVGYLTTLSVRLRRSIMELQRTQALLEKQIQQNDLMLNTTLDGYILADTAGQIREVNPAYCALTGYTAEELREMNIRQVEAMLSPHEVTERIEQMVAAGSARFQTKHRHKDGHAIDLDVSIAIMQNDEGPLVAAFVRDISEQIAARQQLQAYATQLEQMVAERTRSLEEAQTRLLEQTRMAALGQLADAVSQEIRNPLAVIANAAYYLKTDQFSATDTVREYLSLIEQEVRITARILDELHMFARSPAPHRAHITASGLLEELQAQYPLPPGITLQTAIPDDAPPVFVDPEHILQTLHEIIRNAGEAMPDGGVVQITAHTTMHHEQPMLCLSIQDEGQGMSESVLAKAFDPLFSTKARGLGLGLTLARMLVEINDGAIDLVSQPGEGCTVHLYLPIADTTNNPNPDSL